MVDVRIGLLVKRLEGEDSAALWAEGRETWAAVLAAHARQDDEALAAALTEHGRLIARGASGEDRWDDLLTVMRHKADLAAREWKRLADLDEMLRKARAMVLVANLASIVQARVKDRETLAAIATDINALVGAPARCRARDVEGEGTDVGPGSGA